MTVALPTLDDMADELAEPGFDLETDGWLVYAGEELVGYGNVFGKGDHSLIDVGIVTLDAVVAQWLLEQSTARAADLGRTNGHTEIFADAGVYREDVERRELLAGAGFAPATTYHRMRIDHTGPVPVPEPPAEVVIHRGTFDEATRRAAYEVHTESFEGQFGFVPRPYDEWFKSREAMSTFDWSQLTLMELDGQPVAYRECTEQFVSDENCGYIGRLGVLKEARGRGLAKYLLRDAFALDAAAGRSGTLLHVDTNNPTPALGLYISVGMRATLVIDVWRRTLATR
ncbi:GNAT family N-acetyltransferase [Kribbella qitaiheensis]|uniref:GNAT family N-acetyltransferase n=1 Tax=Kribbella qitaiheensis TaxID=1544730 RepID=A0A7G6X7Q6_9ACTN|nr:GNAT family N-acetyltransferase [Kribbella qitaiheensis]QNE22271.1 GNAT family N-acetyltransferase [Kribbella qitaiheensis]